MPGHLSLEDLRAEVASGAIDTVVAAQVDMQGRLMGKRFHAAFFLKGGIEETHACNYLLATDMEMHTVEGYRATSWEAGYGDYAMVPDLSTLRRVPWLEGHGAGAVRRGGPRDPRARGSLAPRGAPAPGR